VCCLPNDAFIDVTECGVNRPGRVGFEFPGKCGFEDRVIAERRKDWLAGQRELQLALDFDDGLIAAALYVSLLNLIVGLSEIRVGHRRMRDKSAANYFALDNSR